MAARNYLSIPALGISVPISRWSVGGFSLIALAFVAALAWRQVFPADLQTLQQANHALSIEIREYGRHLVDTPVTAYDGPELAVRVYADLCLLVQRRSGSDVMTKLVPDLARADLGHQDGDEVPQLRPSAMRGLGHGDVGDLLGIASLHAAGQGGRCIGAHPGTFNSGYGARNGCWVEVWRQWPDGCAHVQMLNTCNGSWDSNPDGSPRVRWTRCVH